VVEDEASGYRIWQACDIQEDVGDLGLGVNVVVAVAAFCRAGKSAALVMQQNMRILVNIHFVVFPVDVIEWIPLDLLRAPSATPQPLYNRLIVNLNPETLLQTIMQSQHSVALLVLDGIEEVRQSFL